MQGIREWKCLACTWHRRFALGASSFLNTMIGVGRKRRVGSYYSCSYTHTRAKNIFSPFLFPGHSGRRPNKTTTQSAKILEAAFSFFQEKMLADTIICLPRTFESKWCRLLANRETLFRFWWKPVASVADFWLLGNSIRARWTEKKSDVDYPAALKVNSNVLHRTNTSTQLVNV